MFVHLDQAMFNISSPMGPRSNTKILMFHMVLKDWLINLIPSNLGNTSSLAMARFNLVISWALFKYPCNSKDSLYNNQGSLFYRKGNLCCSKDFPPNSKGRLSHSKVTCNNCKVSPSNSCSRLCNGRCNMLRIPLNPYPHRANLYSPRDKFCNRKVNPCNNKTN